MGMSVGVTSGVMVGVIPSLPIDSSGVAVRGAAVVIAAVAVTVCVIVRATVDVGVAEVVASVLALTGGLSMKVEVSVTLGACAGGAGKGVAGCACAGMGASVRHVNRRMSVMRRQRDVIEVPYGAWPPV